MEYCDGGDLHHKIKKREEPIPEQEVKEGFIQLAMAMRYIHKHRILHRDLKSQNIFLHGEGQMKLGDFGIAKLLTATKDYAKTMVGTPYYLSPEIIEEKPYNFSSDIWSLGIVLYEMLTLRHPFDASSLHFLAVKILNGKYPPPAGYSEEMGDLVRAMLSREPQHRPTSVDIVRSTLFKEAAPDVNQRFKFNWDLPEDSVTLVPRPQAPSSLAQTAAELNEAAASEANADAAPLEGSPEEPPSDNLRNGNQESSSAPPKADRAPAVHFAEPGEESAGGSNSKTDMCMYASMSATVKKKISKNDASGSADTSPTGAEPQERARRISVESEAYESDFDSLSDTSENGEKPFVMKGSKVECLRTYLKQQTSEEQFKDSYNLVRSAREGNTDLNGQVEKILGANSAQLFPLLQLLCFLEGLEDKST